MKGGRRNGGKIGVVQLSDPSGRYEAILFQEGLNQFRDLLEKGADVLVTLQAGVEGEDVRARIVNVERLTDAAAKVQKGLRVFVRDETPLESIERRLTAPGEGEVSLVLILGPQEGEVEIRLPGRSIDAGLKPEGAPERSPIAGAGAPSGVDAGPKRYSVQRKMAVVARSHGDVRVKSQIQWRIGKTPEAVSVSEV